MSLLLGTLLLGCSGWKAEPPSLVYDGSLAEDPRFERAAAAIRGGQEQNLALASERIGVAANPDVPVHVLFQDLRDEDVLAQTWREGDAVYLAFSVPALVLGYRDERRVQHELVHAVLRSRMDPADYRATPKWAREGVAVWAADQQEIKLDQELRNHSGNADAFTRIAADLDTVESFGVKDYYAAGMRFSWLEERGGEEAVRGWVSDVLSGTDVDAAFAKRSGVSLEEARERSRAYTLERVEARAESAGWGAYKATAEDPEALAAFVEEHPTSPLVPDAHRERYKAACKAKDVETCLSLATELRKDPEAFGRADYLDVLCREVGALKRAGRDDDAIAAGLDLLHLGGEGLGPKWGPSIGHTVAEAYLSVGNPDGALEVYGRFMEAEHPYWRARTRFRTALVARQNGDDALARRVLKELESDYADWLQEGKEGIFRDGEVAEFEALKVAL